MDKHRDPHMEFLIQFYAKKNTNDVPSSGRHPKNTTSVSLSLDQSPHMAKKVLMMFKYKLKVLQYKGKTSSNPDTTQDQDLAKFEGLHPRDGITRHHALPVSPELCHVLASCSNLIADGQVIVGIRNPVI